MMAAMKLTSLASSRGVGLLARFATAMALFLAPVSALADGPPVVPGSFGVGPTGAANYSIPIQVPPGTAGMVPALSLGYSSQGGNGIVGMGWSLNGLSSIGRCPQTIAQDGTVGTVNFTANDRFCLDGQRLVAINGAYGADGTEYRTEVDSFTRIISHGTLGTGPATFQVWTKSGQILEYGNGFQVLAAGTSTARNWAVDKISDALGNYLTVSYQQNATTGEVYPTQIAYTGNTSQNTAPYNFVKFSYATRSDISTQYQTGSSIQTSQLLTNIRTYAGSGLVFDYQFTYQSGVDSARSRLSSMTICQSDEATCLPPTAFTWNNGDANLTVNTNVTGNGTLASYTPVMGDFGGTGRQSILWVKEDPAGTSTGPTALWLSNGDGTFQQITDPAGTGAYLTDFVPTVADFNGDGKADILWTNTLTNQRVMWINNGGGSFTAYTNVNGQDGTVLGTPFVADLNGDGLADILWCTLGGAGQSVAPYPPNNPTYYTVCTTWTNQNLPAGQWGAGRFVASSAQNWAGPTGFFPYVGNFHGTSRADILWVSEDGNGCATGSVDTWLANQNGTYQDTGVVTPTDSIVGLKPLIGNFGSDGNSGVLWWSGGCTATAAPKVWVGHGDGTFTYVDSPASTPTTQIGYYPFLGDFDGDGRTDVLWANYNPSGTIYAGTRTLWLGNGDGTFKTVTNVAGVDGQYVASTSNQSPTVGKVYGWKPYVADFVGAGKSSVLWDQVDINGLSQGSNRAIWLADSNPPPDTINTITNGLTAQVQMTYEPIDNYFLYAKGSSAAYPTLDYTGSLWVTAVSTASDGIGGTDTKTFFYSGAQMDLHGRGFLGFAEVSALDRSSNLWTITSYNQQFPETGTVSEASTVLYNGSSLTTSLTLSDQTYAYAPVALTGPRYAVGLQSTTVTKHDLDGTLLPTSTASYTYDFNSSSGTTYGETMTVASSTSDGFSQTTTNSYGDIVDASHWLLGRVTKSVVASTSGSTTITRTSSATYSGSTGQVTQTISEPTTAGTDPLVTNYGYDSFGNTISVGNPALGGANSPATAARASTSVYDSLGEFVISTTNALGYTTQYQHDPRFGGVTQTTDPNLLVSKIAYDNYGRMSVVTAADGTKQSYSYTPLTPSQNGGLTYSAQSTPVAADGSTQVGPQNTTYYDIFGRATITDVQGFNGTLSRTQIVYDTFGNVAQQSRPFFTPSGTAQYSVLTYDVLHRLTKSVAPDGTASTHTYSGLKSTDQNADSQTLVTVRNSRGEVVTVTDTLGSTTTYAYDPVGDLTSVMDPAGNVVSMSYDQRGRMIGKNDPDVGNWTYLYDVLGELRQTTDNKGQVFSATYDLLGRPLSHTEPDLTSAWTYDTAAHGIGKLANSTTNQGYALSLTYDALTRPTQSAQSIGGQNQVFTVGYNSNTGQVSSIQYPSGFTVSPTYNSYGYGSGLAETDATQPGTLFTANTMDAEGHLTQSTSGNGIATVRSYNPQNGELQSIAAGPSNSVQSLGYTYDPIGNILSRTDVTQNLTEGFGYDALNRLTSATLNGNTTVTYGYDAIGNLTTKSDVGTLTYGPFGGAGPHQVQSVTVSSASPYAAAFAAGTERSYTWTSFNMPAAVTDGGKTLAFTYDAGHNRIVQTAPEGTTSYLRDPITGSFEEQIVSGSTVTARNYFSGGVSIWTQVSGGAMSATIRYIHGDHLGSTSVLTDPTGAVVERDGYDAWGKRRYASGTSDSNGAITSQIDKGYTGQEELPDASLVHFNARLYDPLVGRFISADPTGLRGGANVYAYAGNNPIAYNDPTGLETSPFGDKSTGSCIADDPLCQNITVLGTRTPSINLTSSGIWIQNPAGGNPEPGARDRVYQRTQALAAQGLHFATGSNLAQTYQSPTLFINGPSPWSNGPTTTSGTLGDAGLVLGADGVISTNGGGGGIIRDCSVTACVVGGTEYHNNFDIPGNNPLALLNPDGSPVLGPDGSPVYGPSRADLDIIASQLSADSFSQFKQDARQFATGGVWDFQRLTDDYGNTIFTGAYRDFANIAIGYTFAAAGLGSFETSVIANDYANGHVFHEPMSWFFPNLPAADVADYGIGSSLYVARANALDH